MRKLIAVILVMVFALSACSKYIINTSPNYSKEGTDMNTDTVKKSAIPAELKPDFTDVVYKEVDGEKLLLDIYSSTKSAFVKAPVIVYIHGGGWNMGSKEGDEFKKFSDIFGDLRGKGYAVVSIDYRLTSEDVRFPSHIEDCTDAMRFLVRNAAKYGIDAGRMAVMGTSAGGHLALLTGIDGGSYKTDDITDYSVKCIVDLVGPTVFIDVKNPVVEKNEFFDMFFGADADIEVYKNASPYYRLKKDSPPILIIHGDRDTTVDISQSQLFKQRADEIGHNTTLITVENAGHSLKSKDARLKQDPTTEEINAIIVEFITANL